MRRAKPRHGRIDERSYFLTRVPADFALKEEWPWIKAIGYSLTSDATRRRP